jgi:hypothetical protein
MLGSMVSFQNMYTSPSFGDVFKSKNAPNDVVVDL